MAKEISNCAGCEPLGRTFTEVLEENEWTEEQKMTIYKFFALSWEKMTGTSHEDILAMMKDPKPP